MTLIFEDFTTGDSAKTASVTVSEADIIAFASRFDAQDFHIDPIAAKATFVGELIASGWHSCAIMMRLLADDFILGAMSLGAPGLEEVRWLRPMRPGDVLHCRRTVLETKPSQSKPQIGLVKFRFELINQLDQVVVEQVNWIMFGRRGSSFEPAPSHGIDTMHYVPPQVEGALLLPAVMQAQPSRFFEELVAGETTKLGSFTFTADEIIAFAQVFDPQAFHVDAVAAKDSMLGGLCASGWHTAATWMRLMVFDRRRQQAATIGRQARLGSSPGFRNLRWAKPVFAGDTISYSTTIMDKRATASRPEWGLVFHRNSGVNQHGDEVFSFDGCVFWERRGG
jgi:acyl dehydratase